jgi:hypothetical protein
MNDGTIRVAQLAAAFAAALGAYAPAAMSYVGPGAGLGMIASIFAMLLAVVATILGLILWPLRKLKQRKKSAMSTPEPAKPDQGTGKGE